MVEDWNQGSQSKDDDFAEADDFVLSRSFRRPESSRAVRSSIGPAEAVDLGNGDLGDGDLDKSVRGG
ncbi:hypothetical protein [Alkalinema sp. FACHB-956]|uniref:hypothetical protein n=1 Tax=Alkalinema sp. FACHB-956 TaxID=2692768 RepID=UPI0016880C22|nr:hypothetical protein [Alkalinema sp. FACHB-956]